MARHMKRLEFQRKWPLVVTGIVAGIAIALGVTVLLLPAGARLVPSGSSALASLDSWVPGAHLVSAEAVVDKVGVPLRLEGDALVPGHPIAAGQEAAVTVELRAPGWIGWLTGTTIRTRSIFRTPIAQPMNRVLNASAGSEPEVSFDLPVRTVGWSDGGATHIIRLSSASRNVRLPMTLGSSSSGVLDVSASPSPWESLPSPSPVFYTTSAGSGTLVAAVPVPGSQVLLPTAPIALTFSHPVSSALGGRLPVVSADLLHRDVAGSWHTLDPYTISFEPSPGALWPGQGVTVTLPRPFTLVATSDPPSKTQSLAYTVEQGSVTRLQQILASLGYLPLDWSPTAAGGSAGAAGGSASAAGGSATGTSTAGATEANMGAAGYTTTAVAEKLAYQPPPGSFTWRWPAPPRLAALWQPGFYNVMTKGAVMNFERVNGLNTVGRANPLLWPTLVRALAANHQNPDGYSWVDVSKALPERFVLWHNGKVVITSPTNTGIPGLVTTSGTYPVYLRLPFQIMRGTNPGGSHYADPVHWINYFNGSDAVHGFTRATYGYPQSLGCVELPIPTAAQVWPYLHIGSLVTVHS